MPVFLCAGAAQPAVAVGAEDVSRPLLLAFRAILEAESKISDPVYWGLQLQAANALLTGVLVECFPRTEESCPVEGTLCDRRNGGYLALKLRKPSNPRLLPPPKAYTARAG